MKYTLASCYLALLLCACGGDPFGELAAAPDAGAGDEVHQAAPESTTVVQPHPDAAAAGDVEVLDQVDAGDARAEVLDQVDAGDVDHVHVLDQVDGAGDAGDATRIDTGTPDAGAGDASILDAPIPPPALCCLTPCSGSQVAAIRCASPAWTCDDQGGAACSSVSCAAGTSCHWQGTTCVGTVAPCP